MAVATSSADNDDELLPSNMLRESGDASRLVAVAAAMAIAAECADESLESRSRLGRNATTRLLIAIGPFVVGPGSEWSRPSALWTLMLDARALERLNAPLVSKEPRRFGLSSDVPAELLRLLLVSSCEPLLPLAARDAEPRRALSNGDE